MNNSTFLFENIVADSEKGTRIFLGQNLIIHCHHYNSRLQRTIEDNPQINGKKIIKESSSKVFYSMMQKSFTQQPTVAKDKIASDLYAFLGFGELDFSLIDKEVITSKSSHFVEGWKCGSIKRNGPICTFTEGYLEAATKFILGKSYQATEHKCMNNGDSCCEFKIKKCDTDINLQYKKNKPDLKFSKIEDDNSNIDKQKIVNAVLSIPLIGNGEGLIPAFNVYLALMPQDIYNLMVISFVEEMDKINMRQLAVNLLLEDAENCALNTFSGILNSPEWGGLIAPMVKEDRDKIFGLVAVANSLGWGQISIEKHKDKASLALQSSNNYEAYGYMEFGDLVNNTSNRCYMLTGISAGLMELIYSKGEFDERVGTYDGDEQECACTKHSSCKFIAVNAS